MQTVTDAIYLGVVKSRGQRGPIAAASLSPLLRSSTDRSRWETITLGPAERRANFPNGGNVSWLQAPDAAIAGTLWQFEVAEQPTYYDNPADPWRDRYMVAPRTAYPVCEVLDLDRLGGEPEGRELVTTYGVSFEGQAPNGLFYLRIDGTLWTDPPVHFIPRDSLAQLWIIELPNSGVLRWVRYESAVNLTEFDYGYKRLVLPPNVRPAGTVQLRDWSTDEALLVRVLRSARKYDRAYADALGLSEKLVSHFGGVLSGPIPDPDFEAARIKRVDRFLRGLKAAHELMTAATMVVENGPLAHSIEITKEEILVEARQTALRQARQELGDHDATLQGLQRQIVDKQRELQALEQAIADTRSKHEVQVSRLESDLTERVNAAIKKPEELLGSIALFRAVTGGTAPRRDSRQSRQIVDAITSLNIPATECLTESNLFQSLQRELIKRDVSKVVASSLHASFLGGAVPLLTGSRSKEALAAYADCVAGGRLCWIPVSAGWLEPSDYLGRIDPRSGCLSSHPSGLIELLLQATADSSLHLVVFEGANRAAIESYLVPLFACHQDAGLNRGRRYPVAGLQNGATCLPFPPDGRIAWPTNVLMAGTLVDGPMAMPVPKEAWEYATLILCDELSPGIELEALLDLHPDNRRQHCDDQLPSYISAQLWESLKAACREHDLTPISELWLKLSQNTKLSPGARDIAFKVFAAARRSLDDVSALNIAVCHAVLPLLADDTRLSGVLLPELAAIYKDPQGAVEAARRLTT
jgi:hypothetical protein